MLLDLRSAWEASTGRTLTPATVTITLTSPAPTLARTQYPSAVTIAIAALAPTLLFAQTLTPATVGVAVTVLDPQLVVSGIGGVGGGVLPHFFTAAPAAQVICPRPVRITVHVLAPRLVATTTLQPRAVGIRLRVGEVALERAPSRRQLDDEAEVLGIGELARN